MADSQLLAKGREPISVGALTLLLKSTVESVFGDVYVVGEVSNFVRSKPGHCYWTLKDESAQISAVIWRSVAEKMPFEMKNGLSVLCRGRVEVYPPHGKYQLIVSRIEPTGIGSLELAFRQLYAKLEKEGLFEARRKKPIPSRPERVALVTSATGAAIRDFLNIAYRRSRSVSLLIVPVQVQGEGASGQIAQALTRLSNRFSPQAPDPAFRLDAVALVRGGGSMEDLWAFNTEPTVRAIAASRLPIVTGIGHEIDVTLSDLAADLHALTPSDAAARLISDDAQMANALDSFSGRLKIGLDRTLLFVRQRLDAAANRPIFSDPVDRILGPGRIAVDALDTRLDREIDRVWGRANGLLAQTAARLDALSPLAILGRGYSLTESASGALLRSVVQTAAGDEIVTRLADGRITSVVKEITS